MAARGIAVVRPTPVRGFDDPSVDVYRSVRDADLRGRRHLFMAESEVVVRRLLRTHWPLHSLLLSPGKFDRLSGLLDDLPEDIPVHVADLSLMTRIAGFRVHRGALAAVHRPRAEDLSFDRLVGRLSGRSALSIVLAEGITNVDNIGALFRNAAAFGADAVVLDGSCCDPLYRKAVRVSVGHVLSVPFAVANDFPAAINRLRQDLDMHVLAIEAGRGGEPLGTMESSDRQAIVMGSEEAGLSASTAAACNAVSEISMSGAVPSLNVAVASAIALYELQRRT